MNTPAKQLGNNGWKKGQSGNPKGRAPTAKCIPDILREIGDRPVTDWLLAQLHSKYGPAHNPKTMREAMLMAAAADAAQGDKDARTFIAERTEGKITDRLITEDVTPREVVFREIRVGEVVSREPVGVVRTILRKPTQ